MFSRAPLKNSEVRARVGEEPCQLRYMDTDTVIGYNTYPTRGYAILQKTVTRRYG
jgi:hypothetical protein